MHFEHLKRRVSLLSGLALSALAFAGGAHAVPVGYIDSASFFADLPGAPSTLDFEGETAGTVITTGTTVDGKITFTFTLDGGGLDMRVSDDDETTSPNNYLGIFDDPDADNFLSGDTFTMTFPGGTVTAIGLFVIGLDIIDDDFELTTNGSVAGSVLNGVADSILTGGSDVFFLGIIDPDGFTSATLESFDPFSEGLFEYIVDDIVTTSAIVAVPEPGTIALFGLGMLGMAVARRRANPASA